MGSLIDVRDVSASLKDLVGLPTLALVPGAVRQVFNPFTTVSWYAAYWADDPINVLSAGAVTTWKDGTPNGRDLAQPTSTKRPVWAATSGPNSKGGITADGVDDFMLTAGWGTLSQRLSVVYIGSVVPGGQAAAFSGLASGSCMLYDQSGVGETMFAGANGPSAAHSGSARAYRCDFNGASSRMTINGAAPVTGSPSTGTMTGLVAWAYNNGPTAGFYSAGTAAFIGVYSGDVTGDVNWAAFVAWVSSTYGLTIS